ncbi:hypothetical protein TNCV_2958861 [Trichonephila clavipes]|nr:hypothetical protein TNCV_2958861 [Trichonephila clavipes]
MPPKPTVYTRIITDKASQRGEPMVRVSLTNLKNPRSYVSEAVHNILSCDVPNQSTYRIQRATQTATAGSDGVQSERPIFDDFFQDLWPYVGNNTASVVFQIVKRLWVIRIDQ